VRRIGPIYCVCLVISCTNFYVITTVINYEYIVIIEDLFMNFVCRKREEKREVSEYVVVVK